MKNNITDLKLSSEKVNEIKSIAEIVSDSICSLQDLEFLNNEDLVVIAVLQYNLEKPIAKYPLEIIVQLGIIVGILFERNRLSRKGLVLDV